MSVPSIQGKVYIIQVYKGILYIYIYILYKYIYICIYVCLYFMFEKNPVKLAGFDLN